MRDIVQDAAIITVAKQAMTEEGFVSVETFLRAYSSEKSRPELISTLSLFGLIWQRWEQGRWETFGKYVWYWQTETPL